MKTEPPQQPETIDLTPTWSQVIQTLILGIQNNSKEAKDELQRMATAADRYIQISRNESAFSESAIKCADYIVDKKERADFVNHINEGNDAKNHIYWHAMNILNRLDQLPNHP